MTTLKDFVKDMFKKPELETREIVVESIENSWVEYHTADKKAGGAVHVDHFPDKPKIGGKYYLTVIGGDVKGLAKKKGEQ